MIASGNKPSQTSDEWAAYAEDMRIEQAVAPLGLWERQAIARAETERARAKIAEAKERAKQKETSNA